METVSFPQRNDTSSAAEGAGSAVERKKTDKTVIAILILFIDVITSPFAHIRDSLFIGNLDLIFKGVFVLD